MSSPQRIPRSARISPAKPAARPTPARRGILRTLSQDESLYASIVGDQFPKPTVRRTVSFDITETRTYPRVLDDSQHGPALSIGWEPVSTDVTTVQDFYLEHAISSRGEMQPLRPEERIDILVKAGYKKKDLIQHMMPAPMKASEADRAVPAKLSESKTVVYKLKRAAQKLTGNNAAA